MRANMPDTAPNTTLVPKVGAVSPDCRRRQNHVMVAFVPVDAIWVQPVGVKDAPEVFVSTERKAMSPFAQSDGRAGVTVPPTENVADIAPWPTESGYSRTVAAQGLLTVVGMRVPGHTRSES